MKPIYTFSNLNKNIIKRSQLYYVLYNFYENFVNQTCLELCCIDRERKREKKIAKLHVVHFSGQTSQELQQENILFIIKSFSTL